MQYQIPMQQYGHLKPNKVAVRLRLKKNSDGEPTRKKGKKEGFVSGKLKQQNNILNEHINQLATIKGPDINISKHVESISNAYQQRIKEKNQVIGLLVSKLRQVFKQLYAEAETISKHIQKDYKYSEQQMPINIDNDHELRQTPGRHARKQDINSAEDRKYIISNNPTQGGGQTYGSTVTQAHKNLAIQSTIVQTQSCMNPSTQRNHEIQQYESSHSSQENTSMINAELRAQASEMEHYIITLKQELNAKERVIIELQGQTMYFKSMCKEMAELLKEQEHRCKILEEEISGYEQKIDKIEQQGKIRSRSDLERQRTPYELDEEQGRERKHSNMEGRANRQEDAQYDEYGWDGQQQDKLQQIYTKTQQTLGKYHKLQKHMQEKQKQCSRLGRVIEQVMEYLSMEYDVGEYEYGEQSGLGSRITNEIENRMEQMQQQQHERETKLEQMISEQLDSLLQALSIASLSSADTDSVECVTILDKIHRVTQIAQHMFQQQHNQQPVLANNHHFNKLMAYHDTIQHILGTADSIGNALSSNASTLNQLLLEHEQLQRQQQQHKEARTDKMKSITDSLQLLQQLLTLNQQYLSDQNISLFSFLSAIASQDGIDIKKISQYLLQLQSTIKSLYLYKSNSDMHQTCATQKQQLRNQIRSILNQHSQLISQVQGIISKVRNSNIPETDKLDHMFQHIQMLDETIKASQAMKHKAILLIQPQHEKQIINQQAHKIKNKYFPSNPELVDNILNKLILLKKAKTDTQFSNAVDSIFESIKTKEDKVNQQIGRKKQVVKLRTNAIAQICKRGISDRSYSQDHIQIPDQY